MANENNMQTQAAAAAAETTDVFDSLLGKKVRDAFRVKDDEKYKLVRKSIEALVSGILENQNLLSADALKTVQDLKAAIDKKISEQLNPILHHPDFQALESTWRGLHHLVSRTETGVDLKIRVLNVAKKDVTKEMQRFPGTRWDQSSLFKKIYGEGYDKLGGHPFSCIVGDYFIDNKPDDIEMLSGMAEIAAAAHAPFLCAADPGLLDLEKWTEMSDPTDLAKRCDTPAFSQWKAFRKKETSAYVGLAMPRFLGRLPYGGARGRKVEEFDFVEDVDGKDHAKYLWNNAAYALGAVVTRAHKLYGWCACIRGVESGGKVEDLPVHTFPTDDGDIDMKCPTEVAIGDRRGGELDKLGFIPMFHYKNTPDAVFMGTQSVNEPKKFEDANSTANANLTARLNYLFPVCRFAHYLKVIVRNKIGTFKERADMEKWLNTWIMQYVSADPDASDETKAKYPLREASVEVQEVEGNPGFYTAQFRLRPHFQLEGVNISMRLVSKLPAAKG